MSSSVVLMDLVSRKYQIHQTEALSSIRSPPASIFGSHLHSSNASFPILAVAIIGILATAFLLVSYYIFVIKCCLNWHRIDLLSRFSLSRNGHNRDQAAGLYSPRIQRRGLDESVIQSIPVFQFKRSEKAQFGDGRISFSECAVCLNEFQEDEKLRAIPNCTHIFHVDCIDAWLQSNVNCPLCRTSISGTSHLALDQILAPTSSPQNPCPNTDNFSGRNEDYVVIELGESTYNPNNDQTLQTRVQERIVNSQPKTLQKKANKLLYHVSSMGDECIDIRGKDEQFSIQPIRRSFSMDSANDRQLYLAVQEIVQQNRQAINEVGFSEGCSSRIRRPFFSFGHGRGSRSAVQPIELAPS